MIGNGLFGMMKRKSTDTTQMEKNIFGIGLMSASQNTM